MLFYELLHIVPFLVARHHGAARQDSLPPLLQRGDIRQVPRALIALTVRNMTV